MGIDLHTYLGFYVTTPAEVDVEVDNSWVRARDEEQSPQIMKAFIYYPNTYIPGCRHFDEYSGVFEILGEDSEVSAVDMASGVPQQVREFADKYDGIVSYGVLRMWR